MPPIRARLPMVTKRRPLRAALLSCARAGNFSERSMRRDMPEFHWHKVLRGHLCRTPPATRSSNERLKWHFGEALCKSRRGAKKRHGGHFWGLNSGRNERTDTASSTGSVLTYLKDQKPRGEHGGDG